MTSTQTVKVAAFRNAYDHLYRIANVDYHACVGADEVKNWKRSASRMLAEYEGYRCKRASDYDQDQFASAVASIRERLVQADDRIKAYANEAAERSGAAIERKTTMLHKSGLVASVVPFPYQFLN